MSVASRFECGRDPVGRVALDISADLGEQGFTGAVQARRGTKVAHVAGGLKRNEGQGP